MKAMFKVALVAATGLAVVMTGCSSDDESTETGGPAVIYDQAGKNDKSFNEAVYKNGVLKFEADKKVDVIEFEPQNEAQMEQSSIWLLICQTFSLLFLLSTKVHSWSAH